MSAPRKSVDGWEDKSLGSLCSLINGFPFKPDDWGPDGKPIIRIQNLNGGSDYNCFDGKIDPKYEVNPGTMLFAWSGNRGTSFGPYVWSGPVGLLNQHIFKVIPSEGIHSVWFFYALDEVKERVERDAHGASGLVHVRKSDLVKYPIALPRSLPEQTKIAEILSTVDRSISQTEALIAKKQRLKTGLMQDLLTRGIDEHGNLRSEQTHQFKDSPLGRIPVEWEVKRLGSLLANINQGWSPDCESDAAVQGEWGILKTTAVVWEGYQDHENKELPRILTPRPHLEIQAGDLLMTRAGPNSRVGVIAYVYSTRSKLMLSDKIYRLLPTKEAEGRFLCYALSSSESQRHLSNLKTGMAESQTNISQEIVKALMTVCPPRPEQSLIADRLDHVSIQSNKSTTVLAKLRVLKAALMQDLLTGRKRVTALLDRKGAVK